MTWVHIAAGIVINKNKTYNIKTENCRLVKVASRNDLIRNFMSTLLRGMCIVFITVILVLAAADTLENKSSQYLRQFKMIDHKLISNFNSTARTWSCYCRLITDFWLCLYCKGVQPSRAVLWVICSKLFLLPLHFAICSRIWNVRETGFGT